MKTINLKRTNFPNDNNAPNEKGGKQTNINLVFL